jgi:hypothetical protein
VPPSSGSKNKPSMKAVTVWILLAWLLLFDFEDAGSTFL